MSVLISAGPEMAAISRFSAVRRAAVSSAVSRPATARSATARASASVSPAGVERVSSGEGDRRRWCRAAVAETSRSESAEVAAGKQRRSASVKARLRRIVA